jgi:hypothetical protein
MIKEDPTNDMEALSDLTDPSTRKNGEFYQDNGVEVDIHSKSMTTEVDFGGYADEFLALSITMLVEMVIDS